jgi:hypothetical protein
MKKLGRYCKAYPVEMLRTFKRWTEHAVQPDEDAADNSGEPASFYYLQEDYTVTAGIFLEERVVFDDVTDEWTAFCTEVLKFEIPSSLSDSVPNQQSTQA